VWNENEIGLCLKLDQLEVGSLNFWKFWKFHRKQKEEEVRIGIKDYFWNQELDNTDILDEKF
jgi:hypothetical protein